MKKARAEELLETVEEYLEEAKENLAKLQRKIEILTCAKAYLEFIINGLEHNPSLKKREKEDE